MIENKSKRKVLVSEHKVCKTDFCKAIGLMFSKKKEGYGLIFSFNKPRKMALHMFFVFYPIDVLFLDSEKQVVDMKESFKPFTFYTSKEKANYVIELPEGTIKSSKTLKGDKIEF